MTRAELVQLLQPLDLRDNSIITHVALDAFAGSATSAQTVCEALLEAVGPYGTIVMPTFTSADTVFVPHHAAVAFRPETPASPTLGPIAELFRTVPGVLRSSHPSHSFACFGRNAREVLSTQRDNNPLGPVKKLNVMQGWALLLGTDLNAATACHLAEEVAPYPYLQRSSAVRINAAGFEERVVLERVPGCSRAFDRLESRLDPNQVRSVPLPSGRARKIAIRYLVRLAAEALAADPLAFACDRADCASCAGKRAATGSLSAAL